MILGYIISCINYGVYGLQFDSWYTFNGPLWLVVMSENIIYKIQWFLVEMDLV